MTKRLNTAERRDEILNKSLEIISKKGFYNLTIRNIAAEINISEAGVYRHFKNKKEIITMLAEEFFCHDTKINNINENKNSIKKLKDIIEIQLELFSENPLMTAITFQEEIFREYPEIWSKFNRHREKREELIKNIIKEGKKKGEIKDLIDPESFTAIFMGTIRMTVIEWRGSNFEFSILEKGKKIFSQLEEFLKKR
ncbi:MAG: TetR/AcrR family transcriptional regulator [Bacillota bacterium]